MKTLIFNTDGAIRVIADSALGRNRQPWFIPEFGENWRWYVAPAVRISRLGKGIRPEFADRYVSERTLIWITEADDNAASGFMDGAAVAGDWVSVGENGLSDTERHAVSSVSRYCTLKQGDIIVTETERAPRTPLKINDKIQIDFGGKIILEFNIK